MPTVASERAPVPVAARPPGGGDWPGAGVGGGDVGAGTMVIVVGSRAPEPAPLAVTTKA